MRMAYISIVGTVCLWLLYFLFPDRFNLMAEDKCCYVAIWRSKWILRVEFPDWEMNQLAETEDKARRRRRQGGGWRTRGNFSLCCLIWRAQVAIQFRKWEGGANKLHTEHTDLDPKTAEIIQLAALPMGASAHLKSFNRFFLYHLMLNIPIALGTWDFVYVTDVRYKFSQKYKKEEHFFFFSKTVMIQNWFIWSGSFCRAGPSHWGPAGWMVCRWSVSHSPWSKCLLSHLSLLKQKVDKFQCLFKCHLWLLKWCNRRWMDLNVF